MLKVLVKSCNDFRVVTHIHRTFCGGSLPNHGITNAGNQDKDTAEANSCGVWMRVLASDTEEAETGEYPLYMDGVQFFPCKTSPKVSCILAMVFPN